MITIENVEWFITAWPGGMLAMFGIMMTYRRFKLLVLKMARAHQRQAKVRETLSLRADVRGQVLEAMHAVWRGELSYKDGVISLSNLGLSDSLISALLPSEEIVEACKIAHRDDPMGLKEDVWKCRFCSFINPEEKSACISCGKGRRAGQIGKVLRPLGKESSEHEAPGEAWDCPGCGHHNPGDTAVCIGCSALWQHAVERTQRPPGENWACPRCHNINPGTTYVCISCANILKESEYCEAQGSPGVPPMLG